MASRWDTARVEFDWHIDAFEEVRKSAGMVSFLEEMGKEWVDELNSELLEAQEADNEARIEKGWKPKPIEHDGYRFNVTNTGSRARLHVVAATARAQAHEAKHQSILRLMKGSKGSLAATGSATGLSKDKRRRRREGIE